jgi:hypothetical protein
MREIGRDEEFALLLLLIGVIVRAAHVGNPRF